MNKLYRANTAKWVEDSVSRAKLLEKKSSSPLAGLLLALYRITSLRDLCIWLCTKLEQGPFYSRTLREILTRFHDVEIGRYSYGPILQPGRLPRGTRVGAYCSAGVELIVRRRNHPVDRLSQHPFFYNRELGYVLQDSIIKEEDNPLTVGHDVWIGDRVMILPGCKFIGNGAVLAAGAVVAHDVKPYCIVGGVPATTIRKRFDDNIVVQLESSRWWEMSLDELLLRFEPYLLDRLTSDLVALITEHTKPVG